MTTDTIQSETIIRLPATSIRAGRNDRHYFDPIELADLATSIANVGCLQPPVVRPVASLEGDTYELVMGERRFRAMSVNLGWAEVPVVIREMTDKDASRAMLAENCARSDLDPVAEAEAYQGRIDDYGLSVKEVAEWAGVTPTRVTARLKLLALRPEARFMVARGQLGIGYTGDLAPLDWDRQSIALKAWTDNGCEMNWYQWHALCARLLDEQSQQQMFDPDQFLQIEEYVAAAATTGARSNYAALRSALGRVCAAFDVGNASALAEVIDSVRALADVAA